MVAGRAAPNFQAMEYEKLVHDPKGPTMTTITIDKFDTTTVNEWGEAFGLIGLVPDTTAYELVTDDYVFAIGFTEEWRDGGSWVCQIDDSEGGNITCWEGTTPQDALEHAAADANVTEALRENDNCEDAVNEIGYEAFCMLNGKMSADTDEEEVQLDRLLGIATEFVKKRGEHYGIKWEPYQVCEF